MYKLILLHLLTFQQFSTGKFLIRNTELPTCSKCVHFIEHTNNYPYDPLPCDTQYGRCKRFGEVNLITGVIEYDLAKNCRYDSDKCGKLGSEYSEKNKP